METKVTAILTNEEGWQRRLPLAEGIHWLGCAPEAQIQLSDGGSIAAFHLQIVNHANEDCLRLVNISGQEILWEDSLHKANAIPAGDFKDVYGPETLFIGAYTLQFEIGKHYIQRQVVREGQDQALGLRLVLSGQVLRPGSTLTGMLYLQNRGSEPCQFDVELQGFPADCYEINPPPLINAGGEETAEIRFFHRGTAPLAGDHEIDLIITAPIVYPGRVISLQQTIKVAPCYEHTLVFETPPARGGETFIAQPDRAPVAPAGADQFSSPASDLPPSLSAVPAGVETPTAVVEESIPTARVRPNRIARPDLSAVKVIQASSGDFLDKEETH